MDFLASLNISYLPEHQTKINHNDKIIKALQSSVSSSSSSSLCLGFNVCCNCASSCVSIQCEKCKRVKYCSKRCRKEDSLSLSSNNEDDEDEAVAGGHSAIICSLLRLCAIDEKVEDTILDEPSLSNEKKNRKLDSTNNDKHKSSVDTQEFEEAEARIRSEFESYPATLSDFLMQEWLPSSLLREKDSSGKGANPAKKRRHNRTSDDHSITIHIIGASDDAELSTSFLKNETKKNSGIIDLYTDALADVMEMQNWNQVDLCFIGPECGTENAVNDSRSWKSDEDNALSFKLSIQTFTCDYDAAATATKISSVAPPPPDIVIFLNPGFTCEDYSWEKSLQTIPSNIPFLVTTNTEMEAMSDCQYLYDKQLINCLPFDLEDDDIESITTNENADGKNKSILFFGENPSAGYRVLQSNTMANDVYVKSRWMFSGVLRRSITDFESASSTKPTKTVEEDSISIVTKKQKKNFFI